VGSPERKRWSILGGLHGCRGAATAFHTLYYNRVQAMVVIPRKVGESIVIGQDIILTVVEIKEDKIRVEIEYPPEATVHRQEVYEAIQRTEAASTPSR
jgi:carbon storage regulator